MITMKNWREHMGEDMRLRDLRPRTLEAYLLATRLFLERIGKPPETLTEGDIRGYILHLRDDKRQAPSSINIAICALRFFFNFTLQRDYEVFALLRVNRPRTLPVVLSRSEVKRLLGAVEHPVRRMALTTIYGLGLRLGEGLHLQSSHIDSGRQMVWRNVSTILGQSVFEFSVERLRTRRSRRLQCELGRGAARQQSPRQALVLVY